MNSVEKVKAHFEDEARVFDDVILKLIPDYKEMVNAIVISIPFECNKEIKIIDLGCGTGTIALELKRKYPRAKITCVDLAENMIQMAKTKLKGYSDIEYYIKDFYDFRFDKRYDVVVSSLALHHLVTDRDKFMFYEKIYKNINNEGVFYNADVVLGSNKHLQKVYMQKWKEYMLNNISNEEIENTWIRKYEEEDHPVNLMNYLKMLEIIGFKNIDVIWKYYNFAVFGGCK